MHLLSKAGRLALAAALICVSACSRPAKPPTSDLPPPPAVVYDTECEPGDKLPECDAERAGATRSTTARYGFGREFGRDFGRDFGRSFGDPSDAPANEVPVVSAGSDGTGFAHVSGQLNGTCTDAGGGSLTCTWTHTSGGGTCTFSPNANTVDATYSCTTAAAHQFTLTGDDGIATPVADNATWTVSYLLADAITAAGFTPTGCYSLSDVIAGQYTGALFNVRRSSDNANADISPTNLVVTDDALEAGFCAGTSCFLEHVYDQCGTAQNLSQTDDDGRQPQICSSGTCFECGTNNVLCADWDGSTTATAADRLYRSDALGFTGNPAFTSIQTLMSDDLTADKFSFCIGNTPVPTAGTDICHMSQGASEAHAISFASESTNYTGGTAMQTWQTVMMARAAGALQSNTGTQYYSNGTSLTGSVSTHASDQPNLSNDAFSWGDALNSGVAAWPGRMNTIVIVAGQIIDEDDAEDAVEAFAATH